jgi:hypothetical protein
MFEAQIVEILIAIGGAAVSLGAVLLKFFKKSPDSSEVTITITDKSGETKTIRIPTNDSAAKVAERLEVPAEKSTDQTQPPPKAS